MKSQSSSSNNDNGVITSGVGRYLSRYLQHPAYILFISSLNSPSTKNNYSLNLAKFLNTEANCNLTLDQVLAKNVKTLEMEIIALLIKLKNEDKLSSSSSRVFLAAVMHFFSINDVVLNRKKIKKFLGEHENKFEYRSYTHDEIKRLLDISDERDKAIILLMVSTGMRVGALPELKLKHLKRWPTDSLGENYVYQIDVYSSSQKHRYITFCTPECAKSIDTYLQLRVRCGENIKFDKDVGGWKDGNIPLLIKQFNKSDNFHPIKTIKRENISIKLVIHKLQKLGIRDKKLTTESMSHGSFARYKHELHPCHSFRIFAVTQMQRARVDKTIREMLVGHSTGLDSAYYKHNIEDMLQEYLKAVDILTINNEHRLQEQLNHYKQKSQGVEEIRQQLNAKHEKDMQLFKEEMESKFQQLITKINVSKLQ
jgi:integrase